MLALEALREKKPEIARIQPARVNEFETSGHGI
jgi:hypothetical protein